MTAFLPTPPAPRLEHCSRLAASVAIGIGFLGLAGWALDVSFLKSIVPGLPAMVPNTATGFILAGTALWLRLSAHRCSNLRVLSLLVAGALVALSLATLAQYVTGWNLGIDTVLFGEASRRFSSILPGRPSALTVIDFALIGGAILLLETKSRRGFKLADLPALIAITISLLALIGYLCNIPSFYGWRATTPDTGMAAHTLIGFVLLGIGILCTHTTGGLVEVLISRSPAGTMTRRLIFGPLLVPLVTGLLHSIGLRYGFYTLEFASWFFAFVNLFIFTVVVWWNALLLFRSESVQRRAEEELLQLTTALEQRVAERTAESSRALVALQYNETLVRSVLDTSLDAVITADARNRITSWNKEAEHIFGWTKDEIVGQTLSASIIPPRFRDAHERGWKHFQASGDGPVLNKRIEISALRKNGDEFPVELAITPFRVGDATLFSAFVRDITDRKRADEELRRSEHSFRELADVMPQIVWTANADGSPDYFNRRWYEFTGTPPGPAARHFWEQVIHPDDFENSMSRWTAAISNGDSFQIEYRFKDRLTGAYRWHLGRALPVRDSSGRIIRWLGTCTDIDDQKRAQEKIGRINDTLEQRVRKRTLQLEEANKELESFSYSVSHDLRAPLRHIVGFVSLLLSDDTSSLSPNGRRFLKTIADSSSQMGRLIDDLLIFAKMGRAELHRSLVNMDHLVNAVREELAGEMVGRNIEWRIHPLPQVSGDRGLLKQVWMNLLSNAIKYSRLRTLAIIEVSAASSDNGVTFSVYDNGVGFDMRYVEKIFGVFQRLHHADEFDGTGIGLSIVQRIVSKHHGSVRAEGAVDQGATFSFTLPPTKTLPASSS
jgi:PAS domain S-box-containing protein